MFGDVLPQKLKPLQYILSIGICIFKMLKPNEKYMLLYWYLCTLYNRRKNGWMLFACGLQVTTETFDRCHLHKINDKNGNIVVSSNVCWMCKFTTNVILLLLLMSFFHFDIEKSFFFFIKLFSLLTVKYEWKIH